MEWNYWREMLTEEARIVWPKCIVVQQFIGWVDHESKWLKFFITQLFQYFPAADLFALHRVLLKSGEGDCTWSFGCKDSLLKMTWNELLLDLVYQSKYEADTILAKVTMG